MTGAEVLRIACGELGTAESPMHSNRVKYNAWYYGKDVSGGAYPWCMTFVQWCYHQADADLPLRTASCGALLRWYMEHDPDCIVPLDEGLPGDIVIFNFPGGAATDHTGLLEGVGKQTVTTVDGNTGSTSDANGGAVMRRTRSRQYVRAVIRPRALLAQKTGEEVDKMTDRYNSLDEIKAAHPWAVDAVGKLITAGAVTDGKLDLSYDMLRLIVIGLRFTRHTR